GSGEAGRGGDVDDAAGAVARQVSQCRLAAHEAAHQMDVDDPAEVLLGKVLEHRGRDGAGVVDQYVQCAAAKFGPGGGGFARRSRVAHVEDERLGGTAGGGDRFR